MFEQEVTLDTEQGLMYVYIQEGVHHKSVEVGDAVLDYDQFGNLLGVEVFIDEFVSEASDSHQPYKRSEDILPSPELRGEQSVEPAESGWCESDVGDKVLDFPAELSRVEVMDEYGTLYSNREVDSVEVRLQDDDRTLKVFIDRRRNENG